MTDFIKMCLNKVVLVDSLSYTFQPALLVIAKEAHLCILIKTNYCRGLFRGLSNWYLVHHKVQFKTIRMQLGAVNANLSL